MQNRARLGTDSDAIHDDFHSTGSMPTVWKGIDTEQLVIDSQFLVLGVLDTFKDLGMASLWINYRRSYFHQGILGQGIDMVCKLPRRPG